MHVPPTFNIQLPGTLPTGNFQIFRKKKTSGTVGSKLNTRDLYMNVYSVLYLFIAASRGTRVCALIYQFQFLRNQVF